jgi:hypothetical protein
MLPEFCPADVGAQPTAHASPGCVRGDDDGVLESPAPGGGFRLQPRPRAALADQVPDLMKGDEIGHLSPHGRNSYVQRASPTTAPPERTPSSTTRLPHDPVLRAQLADMAVEVFWAHRSGHHGGP